MYLNFYIAIGASPNLCDNDYGGPHPFSEPETRALANFIAGLSGQIKMYFAFHSYAQMYIYPWGDTDVPAPNQEVLVCNRIHYTLNVFSFKF